MIRLVFCAVLFAILLAACETMPPPDASVVRDAGCGD